MQQIQKGRILGGLLTLSLAGAAAANTSGPWSNPLLHDVPSTARGFLSVDLSSSDKPISLILKLVEGAGGKTFGVLAATALETVRAPKEVQAEFAKSTDRRAIVYVNPGPGRSLEDGLVLVLGLVPGNGMATALKAGAPHEVDGIPYFDFGSLQAHMEGNALLMTSNPADLVEAVKPFRGGWRLVTGRLTNVADAIETNAEVVGWMDSGATPAGAKAVRDGLDVSPGHQVGFSLGLRTDGVSVAIGPVQVKTHGRRLDLSSFRPLPSDYLRSLPGGAYLLTCVANPWPMADKAEISGATTASIRGALGGLADDLRGDFVLGVYPTRLSHGEPEGVDLLVELRRHGASPAGSGLKQFRSLLTRIVGGDSKVFQSIKVDGADEAFRLNGILAGVLQKTLQSALVGAGAAAGPLVAGKNIVFAGVGPNLVLATSEPVLRKAVAALKYGRSALAFDPKFAELAATSRRRPTQFVLAASLTRMLAFVSKLALNAGKKGSLGSMGLGVAAFAGAFSTWPDPLMICVSIEDTGLSARAFVPVDFETLAKLAGNVKKPSR